MVLAVDGVPPHIGANIVGRHDMPWHVVACRGTVRGTVRGMPWYPVTVPTACHKKKKTNNVQLNACEAGFPGWQRRTIYLFFW